MQIYNSYFDLPLKSLKLHSRKKKLSNKEILFGPPKCGKTSLALEYANSLQKRYLYLDLADFRLQNAPSEKLKEYINENKINFVIFDNFTNQFDLIPLANIVISNFEVFHEGFHTTPLLPLDFEEYLHFANNHTTLTNLFNQFIKNGNLPNLHETLFKPQLLQTALQSEFEKNFLLTFIQHTTQSTTIYELYKELKLIQKTSKDSFYTQAHQILKSNTILMLPKYQKPNGAKKIYLYDFTIYNNFIEIDFAKTFENMVFLELWGRDDSLVYTEKINFYSQKTNSGYINIPFLNEDNFIDKADALFTHASSLKIDKVQFITISLEDRVRIEHIEFEAIPFWLWATSLEDA